MPGVAHGVALRSLLLLSGYAGKAATQFFILWAFARTSGAAGAGEFALAIAICSPVFIVAELALRNVYQTLTAAPSFRAFVTLRAGCALVACGTIALVSLTTQRFPDADLLAPLLVMRTADSVLDICWGGLLAVGRVGAVAAWMWANTILTLIAVAVPVAAGLDPRWGIVGSAVVSTGVMVVVLASLLPGERGRWFLARSELRRVLRAAGTLGVAQGMDSLLLYLPALFLAAAANREQVGVFAVVMYVITFANLFFSSVMQTSLRTMRQLLAEGVAPLRAYGRRVGGRLITVGVAGGLAAWAILPPISPVVFGPGFQVSHLEVLPVAVAAVALGVEYATTPVQLALNRYTTRVWATSAGVASAMVVAALTWQHASVAVAGLVLFAGMSARACVSVAMLRRAPR